MSVFLSYYFESLKFDCTHVTHVSYCVAITFKLVFLYFFNSLSFPQLFLISMNRNNVAIFIFLQSFPASAHHLTPALIPFIPFVLLGSISQWFPNHDQMNFIFLLEGADGASQLFHGSVNQQKPVEVDRHLLHPIKVW